jgi:hypothetical protein
MNRIYQGKVTGVEIKNAVGEWETLPKERWQDALWQHHQLFQDAVNYYTLALAVLAEGLPDAHPLKALRKRMSDAWEQFPRRTVSHARNLRDSVGCWLALPQSASFADALAVIVPPEPRHQEARSLAVALLAQKARTLKPKMCSSSYWGRFCDRLKRAPNWDYSPEQRSRLALAGDWIPKFWQEDAKNHIDRLAKSLKLSSLVTCDPSAPELEDNEARALLAKALVHLKGILAGTLNDSRPAKRTNTWLRKNKPRVEEFIARSEPQVATVGRDRLVLEKARGGGININKTHGAALFKAFPCTFTLEYLRAAIPKPKAPKKATKKEESIPDIWELLEKRIKEIGDDPIKLSRLDGKAIFKPFTALDAWQAKDAQPCWPDFDKCAFEEALKTLNQFVQKTEERETRRHEVEAELRYMLGENPDWKPKKESDEADEREVPILEGDPRYEKLRQLLKELDEELAEKAIGKIIGPSGPSLRGFGRLREAWVDEFTKSKGQPSEAKLRDAVGDLQREHKLDMGYTTFFLRLCEADYWDLWRDNTEEEENQRRSNKCAKSVIYAAAAARELSEELERLREPVRYTPAEPEFSRRLFMFSDIKDTHAPVHRESGVVDVSIVSEDEKRKLRPLRLRLQYSAPRLIRDHLSDGSESKWLQPMMVALGIPVDSRAGFTKDRNGDPKETAIALMPDFVGRKRQRTILLNFPVDLDPAPLLEKIRKASLWEKQFNQSFENGKLKQRFHLYWPKMENEPEHPWWAKPEILTDGFTCLAVDLGQRRAADFALLHAGVNRDAKTFVELGQAGGETWFAKLSAAGSLRLPGENVEMPPSGDKGYKELSRSKGRNATESEYNEAVALAKTLLHNEDEAGLHETALNWLGSTAKEHSFPEQNDKLIDLYHGALSRYRTWHRWSWRFTLEHQKEWEKTVGEVLKVPYQRAWFDLAQQGTGTATILQLQKQIAEATTQLRKTLETALLAIAHRALPLREQTWRWIEHDKDGKDKPLHLLISDGTAPDKIPWLRGQRGLSLARIQQLETLRSAVLSLNRLLRHEIEIKPEFGSRTLGESLPDPCPELTDKIVRMKEERVNQTAHLIVAQALGVRLKTPSFSDEERVRADVHGEYAVIPGRLPVDFIVLEDLSRYTTDRSRSRSENSRLMKWCHRAINEKVKLLAEPFGIPVLEVFASYSSKFDGRTGAPGFRAVEVTATDRRFWKKTIEKQPVARAAFDSLDELASKGVTRVRLLLPQNGGPLFVAAVKHNQPLPPVRQADINAAVNIGLRAIAGPHCYHAQPKVRLVKAKSGPDKGKWVTRRDNKRENVQFTEDAEVTFSHLTADSEVLKGEATNLFHDPLEIASYGYARIRGQQHPPLVHAAAIVSRKKGANGEAHGAVARLEWEVCHRINAERLKKWGLTETLPATPTTPVTEADEEANIPM